MASTGQPGPVVVPETLPTREGEEPWSAAEIADLVEELHSERARAVEDLSNAEATVAQTMREVVEGPGDDAADAGSRTIEREQELSLVEASRDLLDEFDLALKRLADGSYGTCQDCGDPIGKVRLRYLPRATSCLTCKQREERRN